MIPILHMQKVWVSSPSYTVNSLSSSKLKVKLIQCRGFSFPDSNDHSLYPPLGRPLRQGSQLRVWKRVSNHQESLVQPWDRQLTPGQDPWATRPECPVVNAKFSATLTNWEKAKQKDMWWARRTDEVIFEHMWDTQEPLVGDFMEEEPSPGASEVLLVDTESLQLCWTESHHDLEEGDCRLSFLDELICGFSGHPLLCIFCRLFHAEGVVHGLGGRWGSKPSPSSICQSGHAWSCVHLPLRPWPHTLLSLPICNSHASLWAFALAVLFAWKALPHLSFSMTHCPLNNDSSQYPLPDPHTMPSRGTVNFVCFVCWSIPSA